MYIAKNDKEIKFVNLTESALVEVLRDGYTVKGINETFKSKVKAMEYTGNGKSELLYVEVNPDGSAFCVKNLRGSHPTAYVRLADTIYEDLQKKKQYDEGVFAEMAPSGNVCVDINYFEYGSPMKDSCLPEGAWIGWDYAHCGDWTQNFPVGSMEDKMFGHCEDEHKYTTEEVANAAREVCTSCRNFDAWYPIW